MQGIRRSELNTGDVVLVYVGQHGGRESIGLIKYIGSIRSPSCDILKEYCGIELIEPTESGHDGSIDGYQYFTCKKSCGIHIVVTNVVRKIEAQEIMGKLQEVIEMFKSKLSQYVECLNDRDRIIKDQQATIKKYKGLLSIAQANNANLSANENPNANSNSYHHAILQSRSANSSPYYGAIQPAALTPITDPINLFEMGQSHQSLDQMINKVDFAINNSNQSNPMTISINAARVNHKYHPMAETPMTTKSYSPRTATNTLDSGTPSSATPAPRSHANTHNQHKKNKSRLGLTDNPSNCTMLIHEDNSTLRETVTPTTYKVHILLITCLYIPLCMKLIAITSLITLQNIHLFPYFCLLYDYKYTADCICI